MCCTCADTRCKEENPYGPAPTCLGCGRRVEKWTDLDGEFCKRCWGTDRRRSPDKTEGNR